MGCCVSSHHDKKTPTNLSSLQNDKPQFPCISKSPPRAEEEAVKEVLSETPKPKPRPRSRPDSPKRPLSGEQVEVAKPEMLILTPKKAYPELKQVPVSYPELKPVPVSYPDPCTPEAVSEASETVSITTLKEEGEVVDQLQKIMYRSQGQNGNFNSQYQHYHQPKQQQRRSPARRRPEQPSPPRRRNIGPGGPKREFVGDGNSGRRSQSPGGMRGNNVGRSPSARRTGPSPGRVRMGPENGKKMEVEENEELRRESEEWEGPKESLENPLVSLECFIFL